MSQDVVDQLKSTQPVKLYMTSLAISILPKSLLPFVPSLSLQACKFQRILANNINKLLNFSESMRTGMLYDARDVDHHHGQEPHFLEACYLCRKQLGYNSDIFMYRGNTPFCSKECREEQIEIDEAKEKSWKISSSSSKRTQRSSESSKKTAPTGTVVVA